MIFQKVFVFSLILAVKSDAQLDGCKSNPCKNGATCLNQPDSSASYKCVCSPGYWGTNCQHKYEDGSEEDNSNELRKLSAKHCKNGGIFHRDGLPCECPDGFSGARCEVYSSNNFCTSTTCLNNGICYQNGLNVKCKCHDYYYGSRCEYLKTYSYNRRTTGLSSFSSLLMIIGLIALIAYCFCFKQKRNETGPFLTGNHSIPGPFFRPATVPCSYPQNPFFNPNPTNSAFGNPTNANFQINLPQTQINDSEERYRVNQAPPSYEEVQNMKKTSS